MNQTVPGPGQQEGADSERPVQLTAEEARVLQDAARAWRDVPRAVPAGGIDPDLDLAEERGSRPGERYVRIVRPRRQGFERVAPGWLQATSRASEPKTGMARRMAHLRRTLLGNPLETRHFAHQRLTKAMALAILSSDSLSSVAYGPEAILAVLAVAGGVAYGAVLPILGAILFLLVALILSYRQVIHEYPNSGGSYVVARENLGARYGLIAGAALITDYILTVAVSVTSGVQQIASAAQSLQPYIAEISAGFIVLIMLGNLRGVRESATAFAWPTYLYVFSILAMVGAVFVRLAMGTLHTGTPHFDGVKVDVNAFGILLVLKAFSNGCSSLTGIEALSNSVNAFKPPEARNARTTLAWMGVLLAAMLIGIGIATKLLGFTVKADESLLSQVAHAAFANTLPYYVVIGSTFAVLILAANTAFTGFPRLFYFMASDNYAPHQFKRLGDRLAYSNGIVLLALLAIVLVLAFNGNTLRLIPLYTVGVFIAFTLAQLGMVRRWRRLKKPGWRRGIVVNGVGMVMTAAVFIVTASDKFLDGAWIIVIVIPLLVLLLQSVHRHYTDLSERAAVETPTTPTKVQPIAIVPVADLNAVALQSLALARKISDNVVAVHVSDDEEQIARLRAKWEAWGNHVPLEIIESPYRSLVRPLMAYIDAIDKQRRDDTLIIVLPEMVATRWWHHLLHNQTALRLKAALLFRPGTVVVNVPYHLQRVPRVRRRMRVRDTGDDDI
ncbi:MAG TPA: APC family permease [Candidatus Dormibacteraeota bacterium]|nr:APC family permease [Candidatus Dormibacteraeota bacterium]